MKITIEPAINGVIIRESRNKKENKKTWLAEIQVKIPAKYFFTDEYGRSFELIIREKEENDNE